MLTMQQLRGLSYEKASLYGLPHLGVEYTKGGHRLTVDSCIICGKPATNAHHVIPIRSGKTFHHPAGFELKSPLFALCGSGTTGCHNAFHGGAKYRARWVWDDELWERLWWNGKLLNEYGEHSPELFKIGAWIIESETIRKEIRQ